MFTRRTMYYVTCDVCPPTVSAGAGEIGAGNYTEAETLAQERGWGVFPFEDNKNGDNSRWHACPSCYLSQEFLLGKPVADALMATDVAPGERLGAALAWTLTNRLIRENLVAGPPEDEPVL